MRSIHLEPHLSTEELERHARQAQTRGAFQRFQALYLIQAQHLRAPAVAKALAKSRPRPSINGSTFTITTG